MTPTPIEMFVIRHRRTGAIMPQFNNGRGHTWWEPTVSYDKRPPRLFRTHKGARIAATRWENGSLTTVHRDIGDPFDGFDVVMVVMDVEIVEGTQRARGDLEIVKAYMIVEPPKRLRAMP